MNGYEDCAKEPIHTPGAVQSRLGLVVFDDTNKVVAHTPESLWFPTQLGADLGACLPALLGAYRACEPGSLLNNPQVVHRGPIHGRNVDVIAHRYGQRGFFEFERAEEQADAVGDTDIAIRRLAKAKTLDELCGVAADEFRRITGHQRAMVYRFAPDMHGEVIAESKDDALHPYLGLHYPASDIPPQARDLYLRNRTRTLFDTHAGVAALESSAEHPVDLSYCVCRAVSPVHLEYLRNMGVRSTFSAAIEVEGKLWGLIACHSPDRAAGMGPGVRSSCELLAHVVSLQVHAHQSRAQSAAEARANATQLLILGEMAQTERLADSMEGSLAPLSELIESDGFCGLLKDQELVAGDVMEGEALRSLLSEHEQSDVVVLDNIPEAAVGGPAGLLAIRFPHTEGAWAVWFRNEWQREVRWGGEPKKISGKNGLSPRTSFAEWIETVRAHCRPWSAFDRRVAGWFSLAVSDIVFRDRERIAQLRRELDTKSQELDKFAMMTSHDLREPLRGIRNYARFLREDAGDLLDDGLKGHVDDIERLVIRMDGLIQGLLTLSRLSHADIAHELVSVRAVLDGVLGSVRSADPDREIELQIGELPHVRSWEVGVHTILANLVSNALKFVDGTPRLHIGTILAADCPSAPADVPPDQELVFIRDHGIGMDVSHQEQVFRTFHRLHPNNRYGAGTGAGLAIVRRVTQMLSGKIWWAPMDVGVAFYFYVDDVKAPS